MANWYYYDQTGKKCGPVTSTVLKSFAQQGLINTETLIQNGQGVTRKAGSIGGLEFGKQAKSVPIPPSLQNKKIDPVPVASQQTMESKYGLIKIGMTPNTYFMLMHILGLFCFPAAFVMWILTKDRDVRADIHGKNIFNWLFSLLFYYILLPFLLLFANAITNIFNEDVQRCIMLLIFLICFIVFLILVVCSIVFPLYAAYNASKGEIWKYRWSFSLFRDKNL
jgi:uncharacterized Tic20 family protein